MPAKQGKKEYFEIEDKFFSYYNGFIEVKINEKYNTRLLFKICKN